MQSSVTVGAGSAVAQGSHDGYASTVRVSDFDVELDGDFVRVETLTGRRFRTSTGATLRGRPQTKRSCRL
jgi:hypothetical protein